MLDINLLRKDLPGVVARLEARRSPQPFLDVARFEALEAGRKAVQTRTEELQARRNQLSRRIGQARGRGDDTSAEMAEVQGIGDELKASAERLDALQAELHAMLMALPNLPRPEVPAGADEGGNVELRRWGAPRDFGFAPRDHVDLGAPLGLDLDTGARLAGSRFSFLRGPAARLHRALGAFMLDLQSGEHGYVECQPPCIVNREVLEGTGQLPKFADDMFRVLRGGADEAQAPAQYLISTSEIPLTNTVREQVLDAARLPIRLTALTPCFRSEAGSAGRDTRGMIRQHQFDKVELVQVTRPEDSDAALRGDGRPRRGGAAAAGAALPGDGAVQRRHGLRRGDAPTTWRSGCRRRAPTARSARCRTARRSRRGACRRASATRRAGPSSCTRSTARGWRSAARSSRCSRTASRRTAASACPRRSGLTSAARPSCGPETLRPAAGHGVPSARRQPPHASHRIAGSASTRRTKNTRKGGRVVECARLEIWFTVSP